MPSEPSRDDSPQPPVVQSDAAPDRRAEPVGTESPPQLPFPVVAIGGSAGSLEAFIAFFKAMPPEPQMAFVLVQHLPPDRESLVAEILARHTPLPVHQIEDGMPVRADHVYVIRPGHTLTLREGTLHLAQSVDQPRHGRPVDDLFRSVAQEQQERAICIVMSGMGSNGSAGAQAVKAVGGLVIAQDPESAKFPTMPRQLIDSRQADMILRPEEMPFALLRYARHPYASGHGGDLSAARRAEQSLTEILTVLRTRARHDFSGYKKATILRRIQRRMGLSQIESLADYSALLRQSPNEITALVDDLMIHVTGFFRDPDAWEALRERVLVPLVREREQGGAIRCWVAACATGEEAYTLSILLHEIAEAERKGLDIKVFATDMAERTLAHARAGVYAGGIEAEITPERLERFFDRDDSVYRIKRELRESVVFAPQNVTQDPPFSRLDVCTCRNLLIYLEPELQQRVLSLLHFGLMEGGTLFLGTSETVVNMDGLFEAIDKRYRIYRRIGPTRHGLVDFSRSAFSRVGEAERILRPEAKATVQQVTQRVLLERHTPASVTIDRQSHIAYFHGNTDEFLSHPVGEPTRELLAVVREPIRGAVRAALQKAAIDGQPHTVRDGAIETLEGRQRIVVTAEPLDEKQAPGCFLISFEKQPEPEQRAADLSGLDRHNEVLESELQRVRDELQSTVEELQSSNEELRASNEETMSVNEELQSSNEELETSKEELQSLNEELVTVNAQLQSKMDELESTTNDLSSLLTSTNIAVVFLDTQFRIRQFTPAIGELIDLIPSDIGRPLRDLAKKFADPALLTDCSDVLTRLVPRESEVASENGKFFMRRVHPYRTTDNRITGVVVTFVDVSNRKETEESLRASEERMRLLIEDAHGLAIILLDREGRVSTWNSGAERLLGYKEREILHHSGSLFLPPPDRNEEWAAELLEARTTGRANEDRWHIRKDGTEFWAAGILHALSDASGKLTGFVKILRDESQRQRGDQLQAEVTKTEERGRLDAEWAAGLRDRFLAVLSHELRTPLSSILLWSQMLRTESVTGDQLAQGLDAIERSAESQKQLLNELLDSSRIASGKIHLAPRPTDLRRLIEQSLETIAPSADGEGIALVGDLSDPPDDVVVDPDRLRQVLMNLLANGIKFTPRGGTITVRLRTTRQEVHLQVEDTGRGIDAEFLPRVFEPFSQHDPESVREQGGLGLGLAISKQLVELHGGTLRATSGGRDQGATFHVRLPYARPTAASTKPAGGVSEPEGLVRFPEGSRILLIEDDDATRRALVRLLEGAGGSLTVLSSGVEAVEAFGRVRPHLIVSDIGLPGEDGFSVLRRIRAYEEASQLPPTSAIALTAFAREDDQLHSIAAGFQQHISKPVDGPSLLRMIAAHLSDRPAEGA